MNEQTTKVQQIARDLLQQGDVKLVIGYRRGTEALRAAPCFADSPEACEQLIIDPTCTQNLANYLRKLPEKTAVVAKGCDARAIAVLLSEHQLNRDDLYIIGIPCAGLVDRDKLALIEGVSLAEVTGLELADDELTVQMGDQEVKVPTEQVLRDECLGCQCPTPPISDVLAGEEVAPRAEAKFKELQVSLEGMSEEEREQYFAEQFSRCVRCFACVRGCPMCYCTTCFAIQDKPQYLPRMVGLDENRMFHLGRAMHLAGRCVGCGSCDRACPVGIPLRALNSKLACETKDLFGVVAGLNMEQKPPLIEFLPGDTEEAMDNAH